MRLLFDQNISFRICRLLSESFSECRHVSSVGLHNHEDIDIWKFAKTNGFSNLSHPVQRDVAADHIVRRLEVALPCGVQGALFVEELLLEDVPFLELHLGCTSVLLA